MTCRRLCLALAALLVVWAIALLFVLPVEAQETICGKHDELVSRLESGYGETVRAVGVASPGIVELFTSDDGASWTILVTQPNGVSCLLAAGESWEPRVARGDGT